MLEHVFVNSAEPGDRNEHNMDQTADAWLKFIKELTYILIEGLLFAQNDGDALDQGPMTLSTPGSSFWTWYKELETINLCTLSGLADLGRTMHTSHPTPIQSM
jgi:hypothetical protein